MTERPIRWPLTVRVEVEWRDSVSTGGWNTVDHYKNNRSSVGPYRSIGYLIQCNKKIVQLAQSISGLTQDISDTITIPRACVIRMRRIPRGSSAW